VAVETCAYIGSGNVLLIQKYMQLATKHYDEKTQQLEIEQVCLGLIGVALISISEIVGIKMIIRNIHHIMQYCELPIKRVVPIMLTIVGIQNLDIQVTDLLYKLAHDEDKEIALKALLGLGVIAAGSNNSRIGGLLRNLGLYYENENDYLYVIRIALGILYAGKGLVGLNQYYSDGFLYNKTGFAGLFMFFHSMMNVEEFLIKNNHYLFYYFSLAFYPKMLFIIDENLQNMKINVRVGQAIDTVGQVGKPRKITGFQTHTSPVIINNGERCELATEEYIPLRETILENLVIVTKNPDYIEEERK
jgi:26S proteasome regulatory subunit N1